MEILFICKSNVGRSQMAEALFKKLSKKHEVKSAGVSVEEKYSGKKLAETTKYIVPIMAEEGCDVSDSSSTQLTKEMVDEADKIIVITEKERCPDYLLESEKIEFWNIKDPRHGDINVHRKARDEIKKKVEKLVESLG